MIHVIDNYYISVDDMQFTVMLESIAKEGTKNAGEKVYRPEGYYTTLANAIKGIRKIVQVDNLKDKDLSLSEAIELIKDVDKRFDSLIKDIGIEEK